MPAEPYRLVKHADLRMFTRTFQSQIVLYSCQGGGPMYERPEVVLATTWNEKSPVAWLCRGRTWFEYFDKNARAWGILVHKDGGWRHQPQALATIYISTKWPVLRTVSKYGAKSDHCRGRTCDLGVS
ncbi:hypothetical protein BZA77DRAFT_289544 [Pyronema omphalodes]|nr:hypothetical protein BZA77DRAFT_289544 [Pyronema omphalodes]